MSHMQKKHHIRIKKKNNFLNLDLTFIACTGCKIMSLAKIIENIKNYLK